MTSTFVGELAELHRLGAVAPVEAFPGEVVERLRRWIDFDGAVFGFGAAEDETLRIAEASVYRRDPAILDEYAVVSAADPVTGAFLRRPARPIRVDVSVAYAAREHRGVARFAARHDLRHLLLFGDRSRDDGPLRWIVLYRGTDRPFDAATSQRLWAAWQHVSCSLDLNRSQALYRSAARRTGRCLALVERNGAYDAADPLFARVIALEWPHADASRLPAEALQAMARGALYCGRVIELAFRRLGGHVVCEARPLGAAARLTARERLVAQRFAAGSSHKEIARELGVSPHTVRGQIANAYAKLGVGDRTSLGRCLAGDDEGISSLD